MDLGEFGVTIPTRRTYKDVIPKHEYIVHQMWYDKGGGIPGIYTGPPRYVDRIRAVNQVYEGWTHIMWTNDAINAVIALNPTHKTIFDYLEHPIQRADFSRLVILYYYGGMYIDLDFTPTELPVDPDAILRDKELVVFRQYRKTEKVYDVNYINNNCLIARKHASVIKDLINNIRRIMPKRHNFEVYNFTGPWAIHEYLFKTNGGRAKGRIRRLKREALDVYFDYPNGDDSGWVISYIGNYGLYVMDIVMVIAAIIIILLVLYFLIMKQSCSMFEASNDQQNILTFEPQINTPLFSTFDT